MPVANGSIADGRELDEEIEDEPLFGSPRKRWRLSSNCDGRLYATLNLPADCSQDDIQRAHRQLVAVVHPDRAPPELREVANRAFERVRHAYEVLSDPRRRRAYDMFGLNDETDKLALVKWQNPDEFRMQLRERAAEMERKELSELVGSTSEMLVSYDARVLVAPVSSMQTPDGQALESLSIRERFDNVVRRQMFVKSGFKIPIDEHTEASVSSQLLWRGRQVGGNANVKLHRKQGPFAFEVGSSLLAPYAPNFKFKANYAPSSTEFYILDVTPRSHLAPPPFALTFGRQIGAAATGFATINPGSYSLSWWPHQLPQREPPSFTIGVTRANAISGRIALVGSSATLHLERPIGSLSGLQLTGSVALGRAFGMNASLNAHKSLTSLTSVGCSLTFGLNGSVMLRLRLSRLGHRFFVPIVLGEAGNAVNFRLIAALIAVPSLSWTALHYTTLRPHKRRRVKRKLEELRATNAEMIETRKREAEDAVALMRESVVRKLQAEREKRDGLVFTSATYGVFDSAGEPKNVIDVRIAVQALVQDSMLFISAGRSKSGLLGFYDPAIGEPKKLKLVYTFRQRQHSVLYGDMDAVTCPLSFHAL